MMDIIANGTPVYTTNNYLGRAEEINCYGRIADYDMRDRYIIHFEFAKSRAGMAIRTTREFSVITEQEYVEKTSLIRALELVTDD